MRLARNAARTETTAAPLLRSDVVGEVAAVKQVMDTLIRHA